MDLFDRAQQRAAEYTQDMVDRYLARPRLGVTATICKTCGDEIPQERIEAARAQRINIVRCIPCQEQYEHAEKEKKTMLKIRKSFIGTGAFAVLLLLLASSGAYATAGSCIQTATQYGVSVSMPTGNPMVLVKFVCTGSSVDGSIPNQAITTANTSLLKGQYYLYTVSAYPTSGGPAPDAADVFVLDAAGEDLLGSADGGITANKGANLIHASLKKTTLPFSYFFNSYFFPPVMGVLTLKVSNQSTVSAKYTVELMFVK